MNFLDEIYFDNTVKSYLVVFTIIAVVFLFKRLLSHSLASLLYLLIKKNWATIEKKEFVSLTIKPLSWLLVIIVAEFAIEKLNYPSILDFKIHRIPFDEILEKIGNSAIIIALFYFIISFINFISLLLEQKSVAAKDKSHGQIIIFFRDLLKVFIGIIGLLFVLKAAFNQDIGTLLTGLSIVGAALALAAKESIENIIASFIIFFDKPFYTGDTLKVNSVAGTVERIGLRSTRIRTAEKTLVTVPNKQMVDSVVDNLSMRNQRRAEIKLSLGDKTTPDEVLKLLEAIKNFIEQKKGDIIKHSAFLTDFGKDGSIVTVEYFTKSIPMNEYNSIKQAVNFELMKLLQHHKVETTSTPNSITIVNNDSGPKQQPII